MARSQILLQRLQVPIFRLSQRTFPRLHRVLIFFVPGLAGSFFQRGEDLVLVRVEGGDVDVAVSGGGVVGGVQEAGEGETDGGQWGHAAAGCAGVVDCGGLGGEGEGEEGGG